MQIETWFRELDRDYDGFIGGKDVVPFFQRSNVSKEILRELWNLVDSTKSGRLDRKQFIIAVRFLSVLCSPIYAGSKPTVELFNKTVDKAISLPSQMFQVQPEPTAALAPEPMATPVVSHPSSAASVFPVSVEDAPLPVLPPLQQNAAPPSVPPLHAQYTGAHLQSHQAHPPHQQHTLQPPVQAQYPPYGQPPLAPPGYYLPQQQQFAPPTHATAAPTMVDEDDEFTDFNAAPSVVSVTASSAPVTVPVIAPTADSNSAVEEWDFVAAPSVVGSTTTSATVLPSSSVPVISSLPEVKSSNSISSALSFDFGIDQSSSAKPVSDTLPAINTVVDEDGDGDGFDDFQQAPITPPPVSSHETVTPSFISAGSLSNTIAPTSRDVDDHRPPLTNPPVSNVSNSNVAATMPMLSMSNASHTSHSTGLAMGGGTSATGASRLSIFDEIVENDLKMAAEEWDDFEGPATSSSMAAVEDVSSSSSAAITNTNSSVNAATDNPFDLLVNDEVPPPAKTFPIETPSVSTPASGFALPVPAAVPTLQVATEDPFGSMNSADDEDDEDFGDFASHNHSPVPVPGAAANNGANEISHVAAVEEEDPFADAEFQTTPLSAENTPGNVVESVPAIATSAPAPPAPVELDLLDLDFTAPSSQAVAPAVQSSSMIDLLGDNDFASNLSSTSFSTAPVDAPFDPFSSTAATAPSANGSAPFTADFDPFSSAEPVAKNVANPVGSTSTLAWDDNEDEDDDFALFASASPVPPVGAPANTVAFAADFGDSSSNLTTSLSTASSTGSSAGASKSVNAGPAVTKKQQPLSLTELEALANDLAAHHHYDEAYLCASHIARLRHLADLVEAKRVALEDDDLELAVQIKQEATEQATFLQPPAREAHWQRLVDPTQRCPKGATLQELHENLDCLDSTQARKFKDKFLVARKPSQGAKSSSSGDYSKIVVPEANASLLDRMRYHVLAKRSARVLLAVTSSHRTHPLAWQRLITALRPLVEEQITILQQLVTNNKQKPSSDLLLQVYSQPLFQDYLRQAQALAESAVALGVTSLEALVGESDEKAVRQVFSSAQQVLALLAQVHDANKAATSSSKVPKSSSLHSEVSNLSYYFSFITF